MVTVSPNSVTIFFFFIYQGELKVFQQSLTATIQTINHIQSSYFLLELSINNAFTLEKQYHNKVELGHKANAIIATDWFHWEIFS